jgi:hypothetical protein
MPPEIRAALLLWFTGLVVIEAGAGLVTSRGGVRLAALVAAVYLVVQMARGRNWARIALTLIFGAIVTPFLTAESLRWLEDASGPVPVLFATTVIAHVAAVAAALVYMYMPAANRYFRDARRAAGTGGGGVPAGHREPVSEFR